MPRFAANLAMLFIEHRFLFAQLDRIGYQGHIGCAYKPATTTEAGLGWRQHLAR